MANFLKHIPVTGIRLLLSCLGLSSRAFKFQVPQCQGKWGIEALGIGCSDKIIAAPSLVVNDVIT